MEHVFIKSIFQYNEINLLYFLSVYVYTRLKITVYDTKLKHIFELIIKKIYFNTNTCRLITWYSLFFGIIFVVTDYSMVLT